MTKSVISSTLLITSVLVSAHLLVYSPSYAGSSGRSKIVKGDGCQDDAGVLDSKLPKNLQNLKDYFDTQSHNSDEDRPKRLKFVLRDYINGGGTPDLTAVRKNIRKLCKNGREIKGVDLTGLTQPTKYAFLYSDLSKFLEIFPHLEVLKLDGLKLSDRNIRAVTSMKGLKELSLKGCQITDKQMETLFQRKKLIFLQVLNLENLTVSERVLDQLFKRPALRDLKVDESLREKYRTYQFVVDAANSRTNFSEAAKNWIGTKTVPEGRQPRDAPNQDVLHLVSQPDENQVRKGLESLREICEDQENSLCKKGLFLLLNNNNSFATKGDLYAGNEIRVSASQILAKLAKQDRLGFEEFSKEVELKNLIRVDLEAASEIFRGFFTQKNQANAAIKGAFNMLELLWSHRKRVESPNAPDISDEEDSGRRGRKENPYSGTVANFGQIFEAIEKSEYSTEEQRKAAQCVLKNRIKGNILSILACRPQ